MSDVNLEDIVSLCKRRGFIYPGSDVYGGLSGTWDYGPLGVQLKRNIMQLWWKMFVDDRDDMLGVDAAILMNQKVWQASGHVDTFSDPITFCRNCNSQYRVDKIIDEEKYKEYIKEVWIDFLKEQQDFYTSKVSLTEELDKNNKEFSAQIQSDFEQWELLIQSGAKPETYKQWLDEAQLRIDNHIKDTHQVGNEYAKLTAYYEVLRHLKIKIVEAIQYTGTFTKDYLNTHAKCEKCGEESWSIPVRFNMMFKTNIGPVDNENSVSYLRPETAQGIFTNYKNVVDSFYPDVPFGIGQQGKAFRNEISPRDFVFRSREFEQMEIEYFVHPDNWEEAFELWRKLVWEWTEALGLPKESVHELDVPEDDRAHYSKRTIDFEYDFPSVGRDELLGLAYRTDFDLMNIQNASGKNMEYRPKDGSAPFVPHVIEPSFGLERAIVAVLSAAYKVDEINGEKRSYLKLPHHLAPVKVAVSPLLKNKPELVDKAREVYSMLKAEFGNVMWDDNGNIGKRYRRQDEIGTPYCVVIDFETLEGDTAGTVTVRNRDTTEQTRVAIDNLIGEISN